jgi:4-aminobutyrate aminotransferase-like enzyme/Ser/Thr protein kinase RdoA (MazF antagonist)
MNPDIFDYFSQTELPSPTLPEAEVVALVEKHFGVATTASSLGSQQDQNFILRRQDSGDILGVLKLSNPAFSVEEIEMQDEAAAHLAGKLDLRIPNIVEGTSGAMSTLFHTSQGMIHGRVIKFIPGNSLMGSSYLSPQAIARMGEIAGQVSAGLADFSHPASGRVLQWNLRHAEQVIEQLLLDEPDEQVQKLVQNVVDQTAPLLSTVGPNLPQQLGHFDITDDNVMCPEGHFVPDAVLDFGDVASSWAVGEIATTVSSMLHHEGVEPWSVLPAIAAFHSLRPLSGDEIDALWPLVIQRGAVLVLSGRQQSRIDEDNDYATSALDREMRILLQALSVPPAVMSALIRQSLGLDAVHSTPEWTGGNLLSSLTTVKVLDASTTSPLNDEGAWLSEKTLEQAALSALDAGSELAVLPAWQTVLTGAPSRTQKSPKTIPTHATVWLAEATELSTQHALETTPGTVTVTSGGQTVEFRSAEITGATLPARTAIAVTMLHGNMDIPAMVTAETAAAWRSVLGDPAAALGIDPQPHELDNHLLERRENVLAEVQEHYYQNPPQMERGWREYLMDINGRVYLDMVNNVASVGHAHPKVVAAATNQMRLLNTNSRFNYHSITEYAEMITATLPPELDTVFFVNSGSEAVDLALRVAMAYTGRTDIVCMQEEYHGWTYASDAVSTSIADNPNALSTRPDWIHTVAAANSYRGIHRDEDAVNYAPEAVEVIERIGMTKPLAGFISESYFGNAGGVALPDGYLKQVYAAVRAQGGLAIADEVQVGFGRLGEWFWGFHQQGVIPDIVAVAKSIGGGHPLGAVITSREIANRYRTQGYFFSSTGGSPVSSEIGKAILGIITEEGLQENALKVGSHLKQRLQGLSEKYPIVGRVHGSGLYLGLEFIRDTQTLEPATEETEAICNRLLELGVIMQPTGDYQNVLKIKPPLVVTQESADYFVDMLEHVLETGW